MTAGRRLVSWKKYCLTLCRGLQTDITTRKLRYGGDRTVLVVQSLDGRRSCQRRTADEAGFVLWQVKCLLIKDKSNYPPVQSVIEFLDMAALAEKDL